MIISAIVAVSKNNVIGCNGHLPWHLPADLKRFKEITTGHSIILGRKNYDDIGRALPNRTNYVLTRNVSFNAPGCIICNSLKEALEHARVSGEIECFIIGGASLYNEAMPLVQKVYLTRVLAHVKGDVYFSEWNKNFKKVSETFFAADEKNAYDTSFEIWER